MAGSDLNSMSKSLSMIGAHGGRRREHPRRRHLAISLTVLGLFILIASSGYYFFVPGYGWWDSVYMTFVTISTVGYGEVHPLTHLGRFWTVGVICCGVVIGTVVLSTIVALVVEGQLRAVLGRRELERRISELHGHVVVCGFGQMGSMVARDLREGGCAVVVIDPDPERTSLAENEGLLYILGDAQDEEVLQSAGLDKATALIAALPTDPQNVFVTLSARQISEDVTIICRAERYTTEQKLRKAGADRVVSPHLMGASRMASVVLRPAVVDFVEMAQRGLELTMEQLWIQPGSALVGKTFRELELPSRFGVQVVAVRRADGEAIYQPRPDVELAEGDTLVLIGKPGSAENIRQHQD
jgi:voltage-gated potassium channel